MSFLKQKRTCYSRHFYIVGRYAILYTKWNTLIVRRYFLNICKWSHCFQVPSSGTYTLHSGRVITKILFWLTICGGALKIFFFDFWVEWVKHKKGLFIIYIRFDSSEFNMHGDSHRSSIKRMNACPYIYTIMWYFDKLQLKITYTGGWWLLLNSIYCIMFENTYLHIHYAVCGQKKKLFSYNVNNAYI